MKQVKQGRYCVGSVGCDAGIVWGGDPCYIKHHPELYDQSKWADFSVNMKDLQGEKYSGVCTTTNWGDGEYPVFVSFGKDGSPTKLEVIFTRMTSEKDEANTIQYED